MTRLTFDQMYVQGYFKLNAQFFMNGRTYSITPAFVDGEYTGFHEEYKGADWDITNIEWNRDTYTLNFVTRYYIENGFVDVIPAKDIHFDADEIIPNYISLQIYDALSAPIVNYGNVLYLQSIQGSPMGTRLDQKSYTAPVIYRINTFMKSKLPIIINKKGEKVICNVEAAKQIKITLTDFMFEPVKLKSPLFITLEFKPA